MTMAQEWLLNFGRAAAGALIFALPLFMTMEMWWLGFYLDAARLAVFLVVALPLLVGLAYFSGFRDAFDWRDDVVDAFTAIAIGAAVAALVLSLLGVLTWNRPYYETLGMIAIQAVPAGMGAVLAREQLGERGQQQEERKQEVGYFGSLFLMAVGALYLTFNLAPTEEMVLIAYKMTPWHGLALAAFSIALLHIFVYEVGFYGQEDRENRSFWGLLLRYSIAGYAVTLLVSLYILWVFGRTDGLSNPQIAMSAVVLAFPGALGAAAARLIL